MTIGRLLLLAAALVVCVVADDLAISLLPANATLASSRIEPLSVRAADSVPLDATPAPNPVAQAAPEVAAAPLEVVNAAPAATPPPGPGGEQQPPAALLAALPAPLPAANPEVPVDAAHTETLPAGPPASATAVTYDEVHAPAHEHPLLLDFNASHPVASHSAFDRKSVLFPCLPRPSSASVCLGSPTM